MKPERLAGLIVGALKIWGICHVGKPSPSLEDRYNRLRDEIESARGTDDGAIEAMLEVWDAEPIEGR